MGLEDFSRGKKIFLTIVTLVGAALFTVTGAMMAGWEAMFSDARGNITSKGEIDGEDVARTLFFARKRVVESFTSPTLPVLPSTESENELVKANLIEGDIRVSLFQMWPRKNDAHVWLFAAAVKKAEEAGIVRPTPHEANVFFFNRVYGGKERMRWDKELDDFLDAQGLETNSWLQAVGEYMMLQDYVASIDIQFQPDPNKAVDFYRERVALMKAKKASVNVNDFIEEATKLYNERVAADSVKKMANLLAGSGAEMGLGPNEAVDLFPNDQEKLELMLQRRVRFDMIVADFESIAAAMESSLSETDKMVFYENQKGARFRASAHDQKEERLDARLAFVKSKYPVLPKDWNDADEREKMKSYKHYIEVEDEIRGLLSRYLAEQYGRAAMKELKADFDKEKKDLTTKLRVTAQEDNKVFESFAPSLGLLQALKSNIDRIKTEPVRALVGALEQHGGTSFAEGMERNTLVRNLKNALVAPSGSTSTYSQLEQLVNVINVEQLKHQLAGLEQELSEVRHEIDARREMPAYSDTWEFLLKDKAIEFRIEGKKREIELAQSMLVQIQTLESALDTWSGDLYLQISALDAQGTDIPAIVGFMEDQLASYPTFIEGLVEDFKLDDKIADLEGEQKAATIEPTRRDTLADNTARSQTGKNFRERTSEPFDFPHAGVAVKLSYESLPRALSMREIKGLAQDWNWVAHLSAANSFVNAVGATPGQISDVIERPGVGLYIFRILSSFPEMRYATAETTTIGENGPIVASKARELAIMRIARELARGEALRIRDSANNQADPIAVVTKLAAEKKLNIVETGWFGAFDRVDDIDIVKEPARTDGSTVTTVNVGEVPSSPFFRVLTELQQGAPLSGLFFEADIGAANEADLKDQRYSFAWISARKKDETAVPGNSQDLNSSYTPQIIAQTQKLADPRVTELLSPELLLKDIKVLYYPQDYEERVEKSDDKD